MRNMKFAAVLALAFAFAVPSASATVDSKVMQIKDIQTQQAEIRAGVEARSGRYKDLSSDTRNQLLTKQAQMLSILDGKQSTDQLSEDQKTEVFNTLEWIEATVNNSDDERMVCERRQILGSTRKERVCKTVAQMRQEREAAREQMDQRGGCSDCRGN